VLREEREEIQKPAPAVPGLARVPAVLSEELWVFLPARAETLVLAVRVLAVRVLGPEARLRELAPRPAA
jgi:hypothetical protein